MAVAKPVDHDPFSDVDPNVQFVPPGTDLSRLPHIEIGGSQSAAGPTPVDYDPFAAPKNNMGGAERQAGLAGRAVVTGLSSIPTLIGDAANSLINLAGMGANKLGANVPMLQMPSDVVNKGLTSAGVPSPETAPERIAQVGMSALSGAGGASGLASILPKGPAIVDLLKMIGDAPLIQALGGIVGAGSVEAAKQSNIQNPLALGAIGMTGALGSGMGATGLERLTGGAAQMARPFMTSGRDIIAGKALNRIATNASDAANTLDSALPIVPGSAPTVSQVSRDPGMMGAENALRGLDDRNLIGQRLGQQNKARQDYLYTVAGDEDAVRMAKAHQQAAFDEYAAPAFAGKSPVGVDIGGVLSKIKNIRGSSAGARQTVQNAMDEAESMLTQPGVDNTNVETLYEIRKDLALARDGKLLGKGKSGAELSNLKQAKKQLSDVIASLDATIDNGAPGYKDYLKIFHERSIPLDQLKAAQALRARSENAIMDQATETPILGARFVKLFRDNLDAGLNLRGKGPKAGNMTPGQLEVLSRVAADIDRGAASQAATVKIHGSDTFKNLSVGSVIGRILGDETGALVSGNSAVKTAARPLSFLYRVPDQQMQQLLIEAWLDPKLAARLMRKASDAEIQGVAKELGDRLAAQTTAASLYGTK